METILVNSMALIHEYGEDRVDSIVVDQESSSVQASTIIRHWQPPPNDTVKINVNGANG